MLLSVFVAAALGFQAPPVPQIHWRWLRRVSFSATVQTFRRRRANPLRAIDQPGRELTTIRL